MFGSGSGNRQQNAAYYGNTSQQQQFQHQNKKAPPASDRVIRSLPNVRITADDLIDEANKECAVCLEEQSIGNYATKLPCGHLYHLHCLKDWLSIHCTCPICRFELETDDSEFEKDRKKRMKKRKLRYRLDEVKSMKISQLKELCGRIEVDISDCIDKQEIVNRIVESGMIDFTEGVPLMEFTQQEFMAKGVQELRSLIKSFGLSDDGIIEKNELRACLLESGRIVLKNDDTSYEKSHENSDGMRNENNYHNNTMEVEFDDSSCFRDNIDSIYDKNEDMKQNDGEVGFKFHRYDIDHMTVKDLEHYLFLLNISTRGVIEKQELKSLLLNSPLVRIYDDKSDEKIMKESNSDVKKGHEDSDSNDNYDSGDTWRTSYDKISPLDNKNDTKSQSNPSNKHQISTDIINSLSLDDLKSILIALDINLDGCTNRHDILRRLQSSPNVEIM
jgi:E3 ubiquitin-protein ligase RNF115/126